MPNLCVHGSERRRNAPPIINITSGFVCELFGTQHPVCNLVDALLPSLFPGIPFVGRMGKAIKRALKIQGVVDDILNSLPDADIPTDEFCSVEPEIPTEEISYADVFLAFTGIYPDALLQKIAVYVSYKKWFEVCQCKVAPLPDPPDPGSDPLPPDPPPGDGFPPGHPCEDEWEFYVAEPIRRQNALNTLYRQVAQRFTIIYVNSSPSVYQVIQLPGTYRQETEVGYEPYFCECKYGLSARSFQIGVRSAPGESPNVREFMRSLGLRTGSEDPSFEQLAINLQSAVAIDECTPKKPQPDPDNEPGDVLDPDFLTDGCEIFPDAAVCENRGGCGVESISVPVIVGCGEAPATQIVQLFVSGVQEEIPGCTDPTATNYNPDATVDDGSCNYLPPVDWDAEVTAANAAGLAIAPTILCDSALAEAQTYAQARGLTQYPEWMNDKEFLVLPAFTDGVNNGGCIIPEEP